MKIIQKSNDLNGFPNDVLNDWAKGRWYHAHRVVILKTDDDYAAISLNLFERMVACLYSLFNQNYFSKLLNGKNAVPLKPDASPEIKKTADTAQQAVIGEKPFSKEMEVNELIQKQNEKELTDMSSIIHSFLALDIIYTGLEKPCNIDYDELKKSSSFVEEYIKKNAVGDSIDLDKDTFSSHPHLTHFDTLIAAIRLLVTPQKIHGYVVDREKSMVKVALNDQSELLSQESFVNFKILKDTVIIPECKKLKQSGVVV